MFEEIFINYLECFRRFFIIFLLTKRVCYATICLKNIYGGIGLLS